jgi:hypothetical protein
MLQRVRLNTTLEDSAVDYPDAILLAELNDSLSTTFEQMIVAAKAGYWVRQSFVTVTSPQPKYRIPSRACLQGLLTVDIGVGTNPVYCPLHEVSEEHAVQFESNATSLSTPQAFVVRGDQVVLLPNPDASVYTLRMTYFRRPSRLQTQQSTTLNGGTSRGKILAFNPTTRVATVDAIPFDMEAVSGGVITPTPIVSGTTLVDIVHPNGWHELAAMDLSQTWSSTTITFGGTDDLSEVAVGDFVRAREQTDWPQLPSDFHRCLADVTTVKVLAQRNMSDKASDFAQSVSADIQRFQDILLPRVKSSALTIRAPLPGIRGRPRAYWPGFP